MFENKAVLITELHVIILINQQTYQCWILRNLFMFKDKRPKVIFFIRCSKFERSIVTRKITAQSHIRHRADLRRWKSEKGWQRGVSPAECFAWNPRSKMWFGGVAALKTQKRIYFWRNLLQRSLSSTCFRQSRSTCREHVLCLLSASWPLCPHVSSKSSRMLLGKSRFQALCWDLCHAWCMMYHDVSWCSVVTNFTYYPEWWCVTTLNDGVFCPKGSQKGLTQWRSARFLQSQIVHSSTLWGWLCGIIDWGCHWRNRARTPHDHSCLTASMLRHFEAVRQGKKTTGLEKFCLFYFLCSFCPDRL